MLAGPSIRPKRYAAGHLFGHSNVHIDRGRIILDGLLASAPSFLFRLQIRDGVSAVRATAA